MVASCSAYGCTARHDKSNLRQFHCFPRNQVQRKQWVQAMRRLNWTPGSGSRICSDHFGPDCYDRSFPWLCNRLKPDAVPTVFNFPRHLQPKVAKKRSQRLQCTIAEVKRQKLIDDSLTDVPILESNNSVKSVNSGLVGSDHSYCRRQGHSKKAQHKLTHLNNVILNQQRRIKILRERNRRLQKRTIKLESCLTQLREKQLVNESSYEVVLKTLPPNAAALIERCQKGAKARKKFGAQLRAFALTLNFYSPRAYDYVRTAFDLALPCSSTLKRWYQCVNGQPGITMESLEALRVKVAEAQTAGKEVICSLVMDEMAIRKKVEWTGEKYCGFVDFGTEIDDDNLPEAKEALVFILVAVNGRWKVPVAYYLINGLSGQERSSIVIRILNAVHETGVHVVSLTFDGAHSNIAMCNKLGANLQWPNLQNWFLHPASGRHVYIIYDPCHMLKLIRNTLAEKKLFYDANSGVIEWKFFEQLQSLQVKEGLHAANKLRRAHIEWQQMKMKVKLAAQTFSSSVADAIDFCDRDMHLEDFRGSDATVRFIRLVDSLFDLMNSRKPVSTCIQIAINC